MYEESENETKEALVSAFAEFGGTYLRDIWLFDQSDHEQLFLREDVEEKLEAVDVEKFVDNERFGFITQDTYDQLYYATYQYTVRGFDDFEQFRMFFDDDDRHVGVFASFDRQSGGHDYESLFQHVTDIASGYDVPVVSPDDE
ncbi:hypothetical protein ZOD2009_07274 [Haladaptatus paucihalophilus DX253]|uniref:Uncharacterized protein n=1 Tax=Haladaptatus paucihalophilus DX253 TaxID=797209 RepID=E7QRN2_HALPU|nr:hypothetical protein [Haladaptatus paucihalophilus]EFW92651.1 hypothetical protein ZOD2009_07274 [Haladaptatus paucihalophilus DX253]SHK16701.1 hypothetical protein SAMN05444342_0805 [Haladaptatus paucihalophilus DX253]